MISINTSSASAVKMTDCLVGVSTCSLGFSASLNGTGLSTFLAEAPLFPMGGLPVLERTERPTEALEAGVAAAQARAYAFAAAGAVTQKQTQHHSKWAFRGLGPWSDPA
ncbi:hypothetical protein ACWF94_01475 [Streptomyces sp. NPDC055078]